MEIADEIIRKQITKASDYKLALMLNVWIVCNCSSFFSCWCVKLDVNASENLPHRELSQPRVKFNYLKAKNGFLMEVNYFLFPVWAAAVLKIICAGAFRLFWINLFGLKFNFDLYFIQSCLSSDICLTATKNSHSLSSISSMSRNFL